MTAFPLTSLVTLLVCLLMLATGINVGRARVRYGIKAPAISGHEMFERAYRVQMNTLENAATVLPVLWVNAVFISDRGAAALGVLWLISRIWYALAYQNEPSKRGPAFVLSMVAFGLLWLASAFGIVRILVHT
jgi:glutathione S-transferase